MLVRVLIDKSKAYDVRCEGVQSNTIYKMLELWDEDGNIIAGFNINNIIGYQIIDEVIDDD